MLVKIASQVVMEYRGNVAGVVQMDTVAENVIPVKTDAMDHLVVKTSMLVFLSQLVS